MIFTRGNGDDSARDLVHIYIASPRIDLELLPLIEVQEVVTLVAAVVAAGAAITGAFVAARSAAKTRDWVGRDQWWQRFSWALEKAISPDHEESELGLQIMIALIDVPWAKEEDNEMAIAVADVITSRAPKRRTRR